MDLEHTPHDGSLCAHCEREVVAFYTAAAPFIGTVCERRVGRGSIVLQRWSRTGQLFCVTLDDPLRARSASYEHFAEVDREAGIFSVRGERSTFPLSQLELLALVRRAYAQAPLLEAA